MPTVRDQIKREHAAVERGSEEYYHKQDELRKKGRGEQVDAHTILVKNYLTQVAQALHENSNRKKAGKGGKYNRLLKLAALKDGKEEWMSVAYIGLQTILAALGTPKGRNVNRLVHTIATRLEADIKCRMFQEEYPAYYSVVERSFEDQGINQYQHKHRVMMYKFNEFELQWNDWSEITRVQIGSRVIAAILKEMPEIFQLGMERQGRKTYRIIETTVEADDWIADAERVNGLAEPHMLPMIVPPLPWEKRGDTFTGGYYTPGMAQAVGSFIKLRNPSDADKEFISNTDMDVHLRTVNRIQNTPWTINHDVYKVQKEIYEKGLGIGTPRRDKFELVPFPSHLKDVPKDAYTEQNLEEIICWKETQKAIYWKEKKRVQENIAFAYNFNTATELLKNEEFYYVYTCDSRGRLYANPSGLSPQGSDTSKGLIVFAHALPLGKSGIRWLAINGANKFGNDKISYDDRISWIHSIRRDIQAVVEDPISNRHIWGAADKPYQFLAFCFEWAGCSYGNDETFKSRLPVGLDGSCNGLQHYSAMLRDSVGGSATNLLPTTTPNDIYGDVAEVCKRKLASEPDLKARFWEQHINRKATKRQVMTLPYGSTLQSCRKYTIEFLLDNLAKFGLREDQVAEYASYLNPILWASIGEVVVAARAAMDWLQKSTSLICRDGEPVRWYTPIDFPVIQQYTIDDRVTVYTQLLGTVKVNANVYTDTVDPTRQRSGIAPNFVHSIDATHMLMTVDNMPEHVTSFAMIHDDYGVHCCHTEVLFRTIRRSFHDLYYYHSPLDEWSVQQPVDLTPTPDIGDYDLDSIYAADYFFG